MTARMLTSTFVAWAACLALSPAFAQQQQPQAQQGQPQAGQAPAAVEPNRPFPPLSQAAAQQLQLILQKWEQSSQATKLLECKFTRWHFNELKASGGYYASRAEGMIRYAAPDKGLYYISKLEEITGEQDGKPVYGPNPEEPGEYWVCNGNELMEFDRAKKECTIQVIPPEMRGQQIFNSPLPFVFNLKAQEIEQRYWLRQLPAPEGKNVIVLEAWPKLQQDRAQYKFVTVVVTQDTFLPEALVLYAPNATQTNMIRDHYEFSGAKRNSFIANVRQFTDSFIKVQPPGDWKIIRQNFGMPAQAANPPANPVR